MGAVNSQAPPASSSSAGLMPSANWSTLNGNQSGNKILASPADGSAATGVWRALVAADIPTISTISGSITESQVTGLSTDLSARLLKASNLSDLAGVSTARTNLGLGSAATLNANNTANNIPLLDSSGLLSTSVLPPLSISKTSVVASQVAMLALTAEQGDVAVRSDTSKTYILAGTDPTILGNWQELLGSGESPVQSVAGRTGTVVLTSSDVGLSNLSNNLQLVAASNLSDLASASTARTNLGLGTIATQASSTYATIASPALTGTPTAPTATVGTNTTQLATTAFVLANSSGTVTSVTSANGLSLSSGVLSFSGASYSPAAGSSSIVTVGTIATGTWNGSIVAGTYGGTGTNNGSATLAVTGAASISGANTGDQTIPAGATPSGSIGLSAVAGSATSFTRSDGTAALSQSIAPTWSGQHIWGLNGAASTPPVSVVGTWFVTGGTTTTTKPQFLIEPTGTTSTNWSAAGTGLGINAPSGFTGNLFDFKLNGVSKVLSSQNGNFTAGSVTSSTSVQSGTSMICNGSLSSGNGLQNFGAVATSIFNVSTLPVIVGASTTALTGNVIDIALPASAKSNGAASLPSLSLIGAPYAAGTATTNFPLVYFNNSSATASTTLSASGTVFGINSHGSADLINVMVDGVNKFKVDSSGNLSVAGTLPISAGTGVTFTSNTVSIGQSVGTSATPTFSTVTATSGFSAGSGSKAITLQQTDTPFGVSGLNAGSGLFYNSGATAGDFVLCPAGTNDTTKWTVFKSSGLVGIGKTGPGQALDVNGNIQATGMIIGSSTKQVIVLETDTPFGVTLSTGSVIFYSGGSSVGDIAFNAIGTSDSTKWVIFKNTGNVGFGQTSPSAVVHLKAGGSAANSAPLKLTTSAGTLLATPESGAFEFDGTHLYFTIGSTRSILI